MTHAEQYSTSEPGASHPARWRSRRRIGAVVALAIATGIASLVVVPSLPASADPIASAQAQAAVLTARIAAENQRIQDLTDQHDAASYQVSQLDGQIAQSQAQMAKDQAEVDRYEGQLRTQAVVDYMSEGTTSQLTQLFSGRNDAPGIHTEYSDIAAGNVTNTVDQLHTVQARLQGEQDALRHQQAQATTAEHVAAALRSQATALATQASAMLDGVDATIRQLVAQQQAAAQAAAEASARAQIAAAQAAARSAAQSASRSAAQAAARSGAQSASQPVAQIPLGPSPSTAEPVGNGNSSTGAGSGGGSSAPSNQPPLPSSSGAAGAVQAAQSQLGVEYTWGGTSPSTGFDCSGLIMWTYAQVGISLPHYSGAQYDDTVHIPLADIEPGDILFYGPGGDEHEAMYIGGGEMVEATHPGSTVMDDPIRTGDGFVGVGRVG